MLGVPTTNIGTSLVAGSFWVRDHHVQSQAGVDIISCVGLALSHRTLCRSTYMRAWHPKAGIHGPGAKLIYV